MTALEKYKKQRLELVGKIEAHQRNASFDNMGVIDINRSTHQQTKIKMLDELKALNSVIEAEEFLERSKVIAQREQEYSLLDRGFGDLSYKSHDWDDPIQHDFYSPSSTEIARRDRLIARRYREPNSLSSDELIHSYRKYAGERLTLRVIASGFDLHRLRLNSAELRILGDFQKRAQANTVEVGTDAQGAYLVPTDTELAIVHEMQNTGPFAGPGSPLGRWVDYTNGAKKLIPISKSTATQSAGYTSEHTDISAVKNAFAVGTLNFNALTALMPYTIQIEQDSGASIEEELRVNLSARFARKLNTDLTIDPRSQTTDTDKLTGASSGIKTGNTITSANAFNATNRTNAGPITRREVAKLRQKVNAFYRSHPSFALTCTNQLIDVFEELETSNGNSMFRRRDETGTLMPLGIKTYINSAFPTAAASSLAGIVGAWNYFRIGYVRGMFVAPLNELFGQSLQKGLLGFYRVGSAFDVSDTTKAFAGFKFKA